MSIFRTLFIVTILFWAIHINATNNATISAIIDSLKTERCMDIKMDFSVTMPQLNDDVVYQINMSQTPASGYKHLLTYDYLIDWILTSRKTPVHGFNAYFNGHHYRYANERLQEYHTEWDSIPFYSLNGNEGVQRQAQFSNLLPAAIGNAIEQMILDKRYRVSLHPDTVVNGTKRTVINAVMTVNGITAIESEYIMAQQSFMPVRIILENNPGALSEQTVVVNYTQITTDPTCTSLTERTLIDQYPEIFEKYRESNFRIEYLPGSRMPGFSLPTTTGERYSRHHTDSFRTPTIIALMDATTGFSTNMIRDIRAAVALLPYSADVIWAFTNNNVDSIEAVIPSIKPGEHILTSSSSLARDCGAASLPALLLVNTDGTVSDVVLGYNNNMTEMIIQKMVIIQP